MARPQVTAEDHSRVDKLDCFVDVLSIGTPVIHEDLIGSCLKE
jgi:hypothetical protein